MVETALIAAIAGACALSRYRYGDIFTPLVLYVGVWGACLILFRLRLVNYDELESRTVAIIALSMAAFVIGCLAAGTIQKIRKAGMQVAPARLRSAIKILIVTNLIGLVLFTLRIQTTFGLAAYFGDPGAIRRQYQDLGRIGPLALLLFVNYPAFICSLIHVMETKRVNFYTGIGLSLPILQGYLTMSRNVMAIPMLTGAFVCLYAQQRRKVSFRILLCGAAVLIVLAGYFLSIGSRYGKLVSSTESAYQREDFNLESQAVFQVVDPYIYSTASFPTFQAAMDGVPARQWGRRTFFPIARLLYAIGVLKERPENASLDFYFVPIPFNTCTYLFAFYEDFGTPGLVFGPLLLGWLATKVYVQMRGQPTLFSICASASLMSAVIYSVFISLHSTFLLWYYLLIVFLISRSSSRKVSRFGRQAATGC